MFGAKPVLTPSLHREATRWCDGVGTTTRGIAIAILAVFCLCASGHASEGPRFGPSASIVLPDGRRAAVILLYGERFMKPARGSIVVMHQNRSLLARSRPSPSMSLVCGKGTCAGYDHVEDRVLEIDPNSMRPGPVVPNGERPDLYPIDESEDRWGFKERDATVWDWLLAESALAQEKAAGLLAVSITGALTALLLTIWAALRSVRSDSGLVVVAFILIVPTTLLGVPFLVFVALHASAAVFGLSVMTWLFSFATGALGVFGAAIGLRAALRRLGPSVAG